MGPRSTGGHAVRRRPHRALLTALAGAILTLAVAAPLAGAHVRLVDSDPADATSLADVPKEVHLRFNEPLSGRFRQVQLLDTHGHIVKGTTLRAADRDRELVLTLPRDLRRGAYEVTWEALSQRDGHVSGGALVFGAGAAVGPPPLAAPATGATTFDAALRWVVLTLLLALIGLVSLALVLTRARSDGEESAAARERGLRRLGRPIAPVAALLFLVGFVVLAREADTVPGASGIPAAAAHLLGERWGVLWAGGELLVLGVAVIGLRLRRGVPAVRSLAAAAVLLVGVCALRAANGHAAVVSHSTLHVLAATAHLVGAGVWLGGVAAFTLLLWPQAGGMPPDARALVVAIRRPFSWLAGGALAVAGFTGLVALGAQVASVDALLTTSYGESLIVKVGLMVFAAAVGLVNAVVLLRLARDGAQAPSMRVPRLMAIEAALGVGALLAAGQVTASAPARGPEFGAPRPVRAPLLAHQAADILISATIRPNRVGTNVITVATPNVRRGLGSPVRSASLVARPTLASAGAVATTVPLSSVGDDRWTGGTQLRSAGRWRMSVSVRRADGTRLVAPLAWTVEPADRVVPVKYSARRVGPIATAAQWVLLGVVAAGLIVLLLVWFRLRRQARAGTLSGSFDAV